MSYRAVELSLAPRSDKPSEARSHPLRGMRPGIEPVRPKFGIAPVPASQTEGPDSSLAEAQGLVPVLGAPLVAAVVELFGWAAQLARSATRLAARVERAEVRPVLALAAGVVDVSGVVGLFQARVPA
jgi:hypothetical protein